MSHHKITVVVDNRSKAVEQSCATLRGINGIDLRGSAFKATEVDIDQDPQSVNLHELMWLGQLQRRVDDLESRIKNLQAHKCESIKKKKRRKASEIQRSFQCPHQQCARIYGSETSLKNHLKIKHRSHNAQ